MQTITKESPKKETKMQHDVKHARPRTVYTPAVDIIEKENDITIMADMPGTDEKSVDVELEKNILTIYGKVDPEVLENHHLALSEYGVGDYQRVFNISDEIDRDKIKATVKNGVLRLTLPKAEAAKTRKIAVTA